MCINWFSTNTNSRYRDEIFSAFNFLSNALVNELAQLFIYLSPCLHQLLSDSWYVLDLMHISQQQII